MPDPGAMRGTVETMMTRLLAEGETHLAEQLVHPEFVNKPGRPRTSKRAHWCSGDKRMAWSGTSRGPMCRKSSPRHSPRLGAGGTAAGDLTATHEASIPDADLSVERRRIALHYRFANALQQYRRALVGADETE